MAHNGDPVMNANGKRIGWVTSCTVDSERFLTGQAYLDLAYTAVGTSIGLHQGVAVQAREGGAEFPKGIKMI